MYAFISKTMSLWFFVLMSFSCINSTHDSSIPKENFSVDKVESKYDTSLLRGCIPQRDTVVDKNNSMQYIIVDSFYTVKLKVGGIDTLLSYRFDCSVPRGLVPAFHSYSKNMICLIRGSGQHYREFIISYAEDNKIIIKQFETALATDMDNTTVVYQDYSEREKIIVENIRNGRRKTFKIPSKYITDMPRSSISNGKLKLAFSDENVISFSLPRKDLE
ncbi:hypothetical protein [Paraflavitalea sp. CAU 1676]|uniref:hypothetical protein n=1 Tax=Paraflavitalea sp. CAU 1676 TaxID=3032598 RepID=UPI0023DB5577|nr:hypothetical protein [Paraflavitalea sp. CAU 1676]MDF2188426.1 hypothetical protein [Paraflavitalea sp. CAU 1676]